LGFFPGNGAFEKGNSLDQDFVNRNASGFGFHQRDKLVAQFTQIGGKIIIGTSDPARKFNDDSPTNFFQQNQEPLESNRHFTGIILFDALNQPPGWTEPKALLEVVLQLAVYPIYNLHLSKCSLIGNVRISPQLPTRSVASNQDVIGHGLNQKFTEDAGY
jgi:hypothetical protein